MRAAALVVLAALLVAAPIADAKRGKLRTTVRAAHGKAPKRWRFVTNWAPVRPAPGPSPAATPTPAPGPALPTHNPRSVSVNSTEFSFALSQTSVSAGTVRVQFDNSRAEDPHQLTIHGPDPEFWAFAEVPAGAVTQQHVTLRPGRYVLFCPLPGHEEKGMRAILVAR